MKQRYENIKLVAMDLDGTLLAAGKVIAESAVNAIRQGFRSGLHMAIATGRDRDFIVELLTRHNLDSPTSGHTWILISEERYIYFWRDTLVGLEPWNEAVARREGGCLPESQATSERLLPALMELDPDLKRMTHREEGADGIVEFFFSSSGRAQQGEQLFHDAFATSQSELHAVRNGRGVAIRHRSATKGNALRECARHLDIDHSNILAIGDGPNDLSMLDGAFGFLPATVANAAPEVIAAVSRHERGFVASGSVGDGVAEILSQVEDAISREARKRA